MDHDGIYPKDPNDNPGDGRTGGILRADLEGMERRMDDMRKEVLQSETYLAYLASLDGTEIEGGEARGEGASDVEVSQTAVPDIPDFLS